MTPLAPVQTRATALRPERGVVLLFCLIALVVMLIGAAALLRSFNSSLLMAGNIGFKRDLQNQADRAGAIALRAFSATGAGTGTTDCAYGALSTRASRSANLPGCNYFAAVQSAVDSQGVPTLLSPSSGLKTLTTTTDSTIDASVKIFYMIDRLCADVGDEKTLGPSKCALAIQPPIGGDAANILNAATSGTGLQPAVPQSVLYRLSVLVTGPRNTRSFFQSTFSVSS